MAHTAQQSSHDFPGLSEVGAALTVVLCWTLVGWLPTKPLGNAMTGPGLLM